MSLHARLIGTQDPKIAETSFIAALQDWAEGGGQVNRQAIIDEWALDADAVSDLDAIRDEYVSITSGNPDIQRSRRGRYLQVFESITTLGAEGRFGYDDETVWKARLGVVASET